MAVAEAFLSGGLALFGTNQRQLPRIEPVPAAIGAFIDFDPALSAKEVTVQPHTRATRTIALPRHVHYDPLVPLDVKQGFARRFSFLVHALKFERIKPNSPASALAYIHHQAANLRLRQFIEARWTFHTEILPQTTS
jgi:hypothetical protein